MDFPIAARPYKASKYVEIFLKILQGSEQNLEISKVFYHFYNDTKREDKVVLTGVYTNREISKSVKMCLNNPKQS